MNFVLAAALAILSSQESLEDVRKNLDVYLKRWAEEYVPYIMTERERKTFGSLTTGDERLAFIETFWRRRDPTPETPENEFRDEYAKRFLYANTQFRTARSGWRTDRGRIYLLMGPPTHVDRNPLGRSSMERPSETWTYMNLHHPDLPSSLEIRFVDFFGNGDFEIASSLDASNISPTGFLPSYSDLDYFGQRRAYPFEPTDAGPRRVDEGSIASERFNFLQDLRSAEDPPEARPQPLSALVGASVTFDLLPFDLDAHTLYDRAANAGRVPVALAVRYDNLKPQAGAGRLRFSIDVYAELRDDAGKATDRLDRQLNFELKSEEIRSDALRYFFSLSAPPGTYRLHFLVRDNFGKSVGKQEITAVIPGDSGLSLSSLILADSVEQIEATGGGRTLRLWGRESAPQSHSGFSPGLPPVRLLPGVRARPQGWQELAAGRVQLPPVRAIGVEADRSEPLPDRPHRPGCLLVFRYAAVSARALRSVGEARRSLAR